MAKKKKNKRKKLAKERNNGGGKGALGANLRQAGTVAAAAIVGEIVEATVERLMQKAAQAKGAAGHIVDGQHAGHHENAVEATTSRLQNSVQDVKPTVQDVAGVVKDSLGEIKPTLTDVAGSLKEVAQETLQRSLAIANPAEMTVGTAVDTARNVIGAIRSTDAGKSGKKSKKKNKKKA